MITKNIIIGLLSITIIVLLIIILMSGRKSDSRFDENKLDFICKLNPHPSDGGTVDSVRAAKDAIDRYRVIRPFNQILAYHVSLDNIKAMLEQAVRYSDRQPNDSIIGYRFYHATTSRTLLNRDGSIWNVKNKKDLIIIPVLANGRDYYNVYKDGAGVYSTLHEDMAIFGYFRPCPKICGS